MPDIEELPNALLYLHAGHIRGNAVAVSPTKAIAALHGQLRENDTVELVDIHGKKRMSAIIISRYEPRMIDIAVIELSADQPHFSFYIGVCEKPMRLRQPIICVKLLSSHNSTIISCKDCQVTTIEKRGTFFRTDYSCDDGRPEATVIVTLENGEYRVVGVYAGINSVDPDTHVPPQSKKVNVSSDDVADTGDVVVATESSTPHTHNRHTIYYSSLVCEVVRVPEVVSALIL